MWELYHSFNIISIEYCLFDNVFYYLHAILTSWIINLTLRFNYLCFGLSEKCTKGKEKTRQSFDWRIFGGDKRDRTDLKSHRLPRLFFFWFSHTVYFRLPCVLNWLVYIIYKSVRNAKRSLTFLSSFCSICGR